jgi:hypothetical protein
MQPLVEPMYKLRLPSGARAVVSELARLTQRGKEQAAMVALEEALRRARAKERRAA